MFCCCFCCFFVFFVVFCFFCLLFFVVGGLLFFLVPTPAKQSIRECPNFGRDKTNTPNTNGFRVCDPKAQILVQGNTPGAEFRSQETNSSYFNRRGSRTGSWTTLAAFTELVKSNFPGRTLVPRGGGGSDSPLICTTVPSCHNKANSSPKKTRDE